MYKFSFVVYDQDGHRTTGALDAENREAAIKILADKDLLVTKLALVDSDKGGIFKKIFNQRTASVKAENLLLFTYQLGNMLNASIPLKKVMDMLTYDSEDPALRKIALEISSGLSSGNSLSSMMSQYPRTFSKLYISMVAAGEASGELPTILLRLANYMEKAEYLKKKLKAALYYPLTVLCFAFLMMLAILTFGIPHFQKIYASFNAELPLPTRILILIGDFLSHTWLYLLGAVIVGTIILVKSSRTEVFQAFIDRLVLRLPLFGPLLRRLYIARFARTMATLYSSGVPVLPAMELVAGSIGNRVVEKIIYNSLKELREGESMSKSLRNNRFFTQMAISMVAAGEEAGSLDSMLEKLADFYETQVDITLQSLSGLLEPVILIGVGFFVGVIIISIGLPFMNMGAALMSK